MAICSTETHNDDFELWPKFGAAKSQIKAPRAAALFTQLNTPGVGFPMWESGNVYVFWELLGLVIVEGDGRRIRRTAILQERGLCRRGIALVCVRRIKHSIQPLSLMFQP